MAAEVAEDSDAAAALDGKLGAAVAVDIRLSDSFRIKTVKENKFGYRTLDKVFIQ